ncbi:hypothetical protein [Pedobacter nyackensis]|uniref:Uncharacterized protein n=1 Tax=Pedobacter nyackensis TaxID=475255 RepID=A0A1W2EIG6_9SPHI|nr:hypothetical protein [Pedobacter nyackensis]SMD09262.1 conserved hypothetical protein (putative transposase or invertase) [Pedobacter nyackensis]
MFNKTLKHKSDNSKVLDFAAAQAEINDRVKALAGKREIARKLKSKNTALEIIAETTGLSVEEIESL